MYYLFVAIKAVLGCFFGGLWDRLFPVKTAADEKVEVLQAEVDTLTAEAKAKADGPASLKDVMAQQRKGKI